MNSHPDGNSNTPQTRHPLVTGFILSLIFLAIIIGVVIIRSDRETISSTADTKKLQSHMEQNMSPLASEQLSDGVISSQLFGRDRADLYTSNVRDAVVASREFLDIYLPPEVRQTLRPRADSTEAADTKHIFYNQIIDGLPVDGSHVAVHVQNGNVVLGLTASVVARSTLEESRLNDQQAIGIALDDVKAEYPDVSGWRVVSTEKIVFNAKLKGFSEDERNQPALAVNLSASAEDDSTGLTYVVSLIDGTIVERSPGFVEIKQRTVYNCPTFDPARPSTVVCNQARNEGAPPIGVADADTAYDSFGKIYDTFNSALGLKSYDNKDGLLLGRVNLPKELTRADGGKPCAKGNAWWNIGSKSMFYCASWVTLDISAHEIGHGVVFTYLPDIGKNFQTGALNEAVADMFGMLVDADDWRMGDDSPIGVIRHLDDPPLGTRPDRMYSELFGCVANGDSAGAGNDYGYIHKNATVLGKAFYLLAEGGTFNGCTVPGIGREKAMKIVYKALSGGYITPTANFKNFYDAVIAACAELYGAASPECQSVAAAGKATEIDQQSATSQQGPKCMGTAPKPPSCAAVPTAAPTTAPTSAPTQPPQTPAPGCVQKNKGDTDCNGVITITDYAVWRVEFRGGCSPTTLTSAACGDDKDHDGNLMDADFNADSKVSLTDFQIWKNNFN